jgi:hypothetical protein
MLSVPDNPYRTADPDTLPHDLRGGMGCIDDDHDGQGDDMNQIVTRIEPAPVAVTPMHMLQVAMERGADLDKLQQLMDLQERWEANEARKAFVAAIARFKADPPEVLKSKHVKFGTTEYHHATLADVCSAAISGLAAVGISHRWDVDQSDRIKVTCILTHAQGHSESVSMMSPADTSGGKNAIQAIASAATYLQRYTLLAATGLAARDMVEDDGRAADQVQTITESQVADLTALADEVGAKLPQFCKYLKVEKLADLPASRYQAAIAALEAKRAK